jgi:hypothetical protein
MKKDVLCVAVIHRVDSVKITLLTAEGEIVMSHLLEADFYNRGLYPQPDICTGIKTFSVHHINIDCVKAVNELQRVVANCCPLPWNAKYKIVDTRIVRQYFDDLLQLTLVDFDVDLEFWEEAPEKYDSRRDRFIRELRKLGFIVPPELKYDHTCQYKDTNDIEVYLNRACACHKAYNIIKVVNL